ncbi:MAG: hypothetical protein ABR592_01965 [Nitriliruptorales bacterium]
MSMTGGPSAAQDEPLPRHETLSHYGDVNTSPEGSRGGFRCYPRRGRESGMSLTRGRLTPTEMARTVRPVKRGIRKGEAVRHTTVGRLEDAGFRVRLNPTHRNPEHVTVEFLGEWTDDVANLFHNCFEPPEVH